MASLLAIIQKYSIDGIINNVPEEELMKALMEISNSSSNKKGQKGQRIKDHNAPKRPTSAYMFWLNENRAEIKEKFFSDSDSIEEWDMESKKEYYLSKGLNEPDKDGKPRIVALVTSKAGLLWKELDNDSKEPFENKFKAAQEEYNTLKSSYRPSVIEHVDDILDEAPIGWNGPHSEMTIDKTIKDVDGKTIKIFKSFTDAIEKAESLGVQCYGITQTKRGFSVRTGNIKKCDKSIASWTKTNFENPIKSKRGRPQKLSSNESFEASTVVKEEDSDNESDDSDNEMVVQEITIDGKSYYLNEKTTDVYDPDTSDCVGKYKDGKIVKA
jgi:hypothetical protein